MLKLKKLRLSNESLFNVPPIRTNSDRGIFFGVVRQPHFSKEEYFTHLLNIKALHEKLSQLYTLFGHLVSSTSIIF